MIRFFTSIGGFLLGALLFAFLLTISFNPNFFAKVMLKDFAKSIAQPATNSLDKFLDELVKNHDNIYINTNEHYRQNVETETREDRFIKHTNIR